MIIPGVPDRTFSVGAVANTDGKNSVSTGKYLEKIYPVSALKEFSLNVPGEFHAAIRGTR